MSTTTTANADNPTPTATLPILLLKTKSTPTDAYADYFSQLRITPPNNANIITFRPINLPVLENTFNVENIQEVEKLLVDGAFDDVDVDDEDEDDDRTGETRRRQRYGGVIFTSQRAVEAFIDAVQRVVKAVETPPNRPIRLFGAKTVFYVVGPATQRALCSSPHIPPSAVYGHDSGNGDRLAEFILRHYNSLHPSRSSGGGGGRRRKTEKPPLLFLVGETRRDIIPRTLMHDACLSDEARIQVDERVVYETRLLPTFTDDLRGTLDGLPFVNGSRDTGVFWIVVFSPTGCRELLTVLGMLDGETGGQGTTCGVRKWPSVKIATIGPTTQSYLVEEFGVRPHVCARKPTPEGVADVIREHICSSGYEGCGS